MQDERTAGDENSSPAGIKQQEAVKKKNMVSKEHGRKSMPKSLIAIEKCKIIIFLQACVLFWEVGYLYVTLNLNKKYSISNKL